MADDTTTDPATGTEPEAKPNEGTTETAATETPPEPAAAKPAEPASEPEPAKTDTTVGPDGKPWDPDRAMSALRAARDEAKEAKEKAREDREKAEKWEQHERDQLSEQEKLERERDDMRQKAEQADSKLRTANLVAALAKPDLGIVDARAAAKLISGVEYDDDGEPTNLGSPDDDDSLISKFLSDYSFLRGMAAKPTPPSTDAQEGATGDNTQPNLTAQELEVAKRSGMTPEEYALFRDADSIADVQRANSST